MPIIEARGLAKIYRNAVKKSGVLGAIGHIFNPKYSDSVAVDGVDLSVEPGESLGYVGPNGAGKSTTIKMLTGILMPSAGTVRVNGLDPYRQRMENTRKIGVVFGQRTQLWWDIAVIESFTLIRDIYGVSRKRYAENLAYLTELLGLEPFLGLSARKLSLGQRMRADLAVSLLYDPEVLFLDEPTIGLDVAVKERIREFLKRVNREKGVTILLTSHDLDDIQDVCSRLVIIDKGSIIYDGTHGELLDRAVKNRRMHMRLASGGTRLRGMLAGVEGMSLVSGSETELAVDFDRFRFSAKDVISRAMADAEVLDFRLEEPDIEDVIKSVYNGRLALG